MRSVPVPVLLTPGRVAAELSVPLQRVLYVLATRRHITPAARAGTLRLYSRDALAMIRHELHDIEVRLRRAGGNPCLRRPSRNCCSLREAAEALEISQKHLWNLTKAGAIKCVRLGRSVRYSVAALEDWIAQQQSGTGIDEKS